MVLKSFAFRLGSQVSSSIKGLFIMPLIINYAGDFDYMVWSQIQSTTSFLVPALIMRMETGNLRYLAKRTNEKLINSFYLATLGLIGFLSVLVLSVILLFQNSVSNIMFGSIGQTSFVQLFVWFLLSSTLYSYCTQYFRIKHNIVLLSKLDFVNNVFWVLLSMFLFGRFDSAISYLLLGITTFQACIVGAIIFKITQNTSLIRIIKVSRYVRPVLAYSIPLIPTGMLLWIMNLSDRYFILHMLGEQPTAIYSANYQFGSLLNFLIAPVIFVVFPIIMKLWDLKYEQRAVKSIEKLIQYYTLLGVLALILIVICTPFVIGLLAKDSYILNDYSLLYIGLGVLVFGFYQLVLLVLHIKKKTRVAVYITFVGAVVNLILNYILIDLMGIEGAALSTLFSYSIILLLLIIITRKEIALRLDSKVWIYLLVGTLVFMIASQFHIMSLAKILITILAVPMVYFGILVVSRSLKKQELEDIRYLFKV
ncbi:MAG: polysaccharide biosynthesis protein [Flavobacteriaceae bacterium]|nr:polysaccharide biosynthesis protein [Flavobacteriaceae bacterium]